MSMLPNWVRREPEKYLKRLVFEAKMLETAFPGFRLMTERDVLFAEGDFVTASRNRYHLRAYYPESYPYDPPSVAVTDADVVSYCGIRGAHGFHHYGYSEEMGGLKLCLLNAGDREGQGWLPDFSIVTVLNLAAAWLHAYEVKRLTGEWILPEA
ncbi:MAG: hypothetical protein QG650_689 [Patescibacteria group bacterium]|nr:hypothetical protein [Patescibacteria group bacterium]